MNFQNIPRDDKTVKTAIVPKRGMLHEFDYKQIEPRLLAYFAAKIGDTRLADYIQSGVDPYTAIVRGLYGDDVTEQQRQTGKVLFLSLMYGGGIKTVMAQHGVTKDRARAMIREFHQAWPVVGRLQELTQIQHSRRGHIKTPWGRHLHMEQFGEHKLLNKLIQGSAAEVMKAAIVLVDRGLRNADTWDEAREGVGAWITREEWERRNSRLPKIPSEGLETRIVGTIHDSLVLDGPVSEAEQVHELVTELMLEASRAPGGDFIHEIVPFAVDHEVSTTNWADKEDYATWQASLSTAPSR